MNEITKNRAMAMLVAALVLSLGGRALAQQTTPPPPSDPPMVGGSVGYFGERGQVAISGDMKFNVIHQSYNKGFPSSTSFDIEPALDYFIQPNLSLGGMIAILRQPVSDLTLKAIGLGVRVGYNLPLSSAASLWMSATLFYEHDTYSLTGSADQTGYVIPIRFYFPVLWHPASHFFLGAGPFFETSLVAKTEGQDGVKGTDFGISSTVGGYFGGL